MVQVTQASSRFRPICILLVDHPLSRLGSLPAESGRMPELRRVNCASTLDFLRVLRIKTLREFMERFFLKLLYGVLSIGLVLFVTGCGEDPRFSANTQYLGGAYGGQQGAGGPPHDTVSYSDGDHASGRPSIKIKLHAHSASCYKLGVLS